MGNLIKNGQKKDWSPGNHTCSNHFIDGKPSKINPSPTLFMSVPANPLTPTKRRSPRKRAFVAYDQVSSSYVEESSAHNQNNTDNEQIIIDKMGNMSTQTDHVVHINLQLSREADVRFYTGFDSNEMFQLIFDYVKVKASLMTYWDGSKKNFANFK